MKNQNVQVALKPDLNQIVKMSVTKTDIINLFEDKIETELKEEKTKIDNELTIVVTKISEITNAIDELKNIEINRIINENSVTLNKIVGTKLNYEVRIKDNDFILIACDKDNKPSMFNYHCQYSKNCITLFLKPSMSYSQSYKKLVNKMNKLNDERCAIYLALKKVNNELYDLPDKIKKFSVSLTKKALQQSSEGNGIIAIVEQLSNQLKLSHK